MRLRDLFAANLKRARRQAGLSQEELAYRAEIDRTYVSALERSVYSASLDVVEKLGIVLGLDPVDLLRVGDTKVTSPARKSKSAARARPTNR